MPVNKLSRNESGSRLLRGAAEKAEGKAVRKRFYRRR